MPSVENDRPVCPTCGARKVRSEGVWWCAMCDDCPPPTRVTAGRDAPCPTCSPPVRETVGMVCQTCGTDYGADPETCSACGKTAWACGRSAYVCCAACSRTRFGTHYPARVIPPGGPDA